MSIKAKQIIFELDEDNEDNSPKKNTKKDSKFQALDRKLGIVTHVKWGTVYNYNFSFDLNKGRLLCYKTAKSKHPNNYYTLIQGVFVEDEEEIQKRERIFQKKKNYIPPPQLDDHRSVVYVRTRKGKTFRLLINEGENHDKIMGYLQMCFTSKVTTEACSFFAMLGTGIMRILNKGFKLNTGILVPLDNWEVGSNQNGQKYLKTPDVKQEQIDQRGGLSQLVNNISVVGAIVSGFKTDLLSLIYNPAQQTIDAITFDQDKQPCQFFYQIFQLVKKHKNKPHQNQGSYKNVPNSNPINSLQQMVSVDNQKGQMMKLKTNIQVTITDIDLQLVAENKHVQLYAKKCYVPILHLDEVQYSMMNAEFADEQPQQDGEEDQSTLVQSMLNFYKKALSYYPNNQNQKLDDTKEFLFITPHVIEIQDQDQPLEFVQDDLKEADIQTFGGQYVVEEEQTGKNEVKCINIQMSRKQYQSQPVYRSEVNMQQIQHEIQPKQVLSEIQSHVNEAKTPESNPQQANHDSKPNDHEQNMQQNEVNHIEHIQTVKQNNEITIGIQLEETVKEVENNPQVDLQQQQPEIIVNNNQDPQDDDDDDGGDSDNAIAKAANKDYQSCIIRGFKNIMKFAEEFQFIKLKDEFRVNIAHKSGGTACLDKSIINLSRSVGKTMLKEIGRKIISGNFNLTTVSFPIKAMIPKSALEKSFMQTILFPLYMNRAAITPDPVEKMRLLMVAVVSNFIQANTFLKPLNPIIGETFEGSYEDGTQLYSEQISHHPPVSYFLVVGPQRSYKFWGYYLYEAKASLNSLLLQNKGKRFLEFSDGTRIAFDFNQEQYSGTFMGTMKHESIGSIIFKDEKNGLIGTLNFGKVKKKPTDYLDGEIKQGPKVLSKLFGSYMGFMEWDGKRYWDTREILPFRLKVDPSMLESDHTKRQDRITMIKGDMVTAQKEKENLEANQRTDAKLRKQYEQKRALQEKSDKKKKK